MSIGKRSRGGRGGHARNARWALAAALLLVGSTVQASPPVRSPQPPPPRQNTMSAPPHSRFDLSDTQLTDAGFVLWLAQQPDPSQPVLLTLDRNQLTRAGMDALAAASLHFLTALSASHNPIGDEGLRVIATSALFESVETLTQADTGITAAGAQVVIGPDSVYGLSTLDLSGNPLGDEGVEAIAASPYGSYLRSLYLNEVGATDRAARALASSPHLADLGYLELKGNALTDAGLAALAASPHLANCTVETGEPPTAQ